MKAFFEALQIGMKKYFPWPTSIYLFKVTMETKGQILKHVQNQQKRLQSTDVDVSDVVLVSL